MYGCPRWCKRFLNCFECVIGCGHVSVAPSHTYFVCAAGNGQAIAKQSAERGPFVAAIDTAAGRYGDARTKGRSTNRAHRLLHKDCFVWSGSFRSFSLTVHRSAHTLKSRDAIHGALRSCYRCRGSVVVPSRMITLTLGVRPFSWQCQF